MSKSILLHTPNIKYKGGVSQHYSGLKVYLVSVIDYYEYSSGNYKNRLEAIMDLYRFISYSKNYSHIVLNPSMQKNAFYRDIFLTIIFKLKGKRVSWFVHGWEYKFFRKIRTSILPLLIRLIDDIGVLSSSFERDLRLIYNGNLFLFSTKISDAFLHSSPQDYSDDLSKLVYFGRIEEDKGVREVIRFYKRMRSKGHLLTLDIIGNGSDTNFLNEITNDDHVNFLGALNQEELAARLKNYDVFYFPTRHSEGLPATVLEAMASGLVVISTSVGGIADLWENVEFGLLVEESVEERVFLELSKDKERVKRIKRNNKNYSISYHNSKIIAEKVLRNIL